MSSENNIDGYEITYISIDEYQAEINKTQIKKMQAEARAAKRRAILEAAGTYQLDGIEYEVVSWDDVPEAEKPFS